MKFEGWEAIDVFEKRNPDHLAIADRTYYACVEIAKKFGVTTEGTEGFVSPVSITESIYKDHIISISYSTRFTNNLEYYLDVSLVSNDVKVLSVSKKTDYREFSSECTESYNCFRVGSWINHVSLLYDKYYEDLNQQSDKWAKEREKYKQDKFGRLE